MTTLVVTPSSAASAYARVQSGAGPDQAQAGSFGGVLSRALQGAVDTGHAADDQAMRAVAGAGNLTDVVTAVTKAELALQSAVAIRDRVVQAYQDVMRMPI